MIALKTCSNFCKNKCAMDLHLLILAWFFSWILTKMTWKHLKEIVRLVWIGNTLSLFQKMTLRPPWLLLFCSLHLQIACLCLPKKFLGLAFKFKLNAMKIANLALRQRMLLLPWINIPKTHCRRWCMAWLNPVCRAFRKERLRIVLVHWKNNLFGWTMKSK